VGVYDGVNRAGVESMKRTARSTTLIRADIVRKTVNQVLAEYGPIALVVYFSIFFAVLITCWVAIHLGWQPESAIGAAGAFTGAYLATKVTQPLRIAATLVITPFAARVVHRLGLRRSPSAPAGEAETAELR
jgi:hypothetical protein